MALMMPLFVFGQGYDALWKQVEKAGQNDLPKTEQDVLRKIVAKAEKEKAYGHFMKAQLKWMQVATEVSSDSLKPEVERLQKREQTVKDAALRAVLQAVLGIIYEQNGDLADDAKEIARQYKDKVMADPAMLAAIRTDGYVPFIEKGADSKIFNHDLLSVLGMETDHYDVMRQYYEKAGNRAAALLSSLYWLNQQRPQEIEKLETSRFIPRLDSLIQRYRDLPEVGEVAIERYNYMETNTDATAKQKWEYLEKAIGERHDWSRMELLQNVQKSLESVRFDATLEQMVNIPSGTCKVELKNLRGISKMTMRVYRVNAKASDLQSVYVDSDKGYKKIKPMLSAQPEMVKEHAYTGKAPYELFEDELTIDALPVGVYLVEFESSPRTKEVERVLYYVSNLRVIAQQYPDKKMHYVVVDATTGHPVKGAQLTFTRNNATVTLTANDKGECEYDINQRNRTFFVTTAKDKACPAMTIYGYYAYYDNDRVVHNVEIYTDRAIYRPGQTIHMSSILYQTEHGIQNCVEKGQKVKAILFDANRDEVETKELVTDDYGTCATTFTLPRQGLTGRFYIEVNGRNKVIRVEEYKRPTFEVEIPTVKELYADGDTLQVKGTARSYAGVAVQGAKVKYKVERQRATWWWWRSNYWNYTVRTEDTDDIVLAEGEVTTDKDGVFTMPMPIVVPKTRYAMFYNFVVTADVTDQAGETHHGSLSLPLGNKPTAFSVEMLDKILKETVEGMKFHLVNAARTDLDAEVRYRFTPEGKRSLDWQTVRTNQAITVANLKSGKYGLEAICGKDTLKQDFVVFSLNDKRPAAKTDDWFYISHGKFPNDGTPVTIQVGSSDEDVHMYYSIFSGNKVIENGTVDQSNALWNRKLTYREEYGNGLLLTFGWVKNGKTYSHEVSIRRPLRNTELDLKWESFRNRLEPGQQEEWTLTVKGPDGKPVNAQLLATLYDKSLDQLVNNQWRLEPYTLLPLPSTTWRGASWGGPSCYGSFVEKMKEVKELDFSVFDHSLFPVYIKAYGMNPRRVLSGLSRGPIMMKVAEAAGLDVAEAATESVDNSLQGRIAGLDIIAPAAPGNGEKAEMQVRENLNETAFFYPQLMTDSEGRVTVKFTLPESLTTWRFMGVAHTPDMMAGTLTDDAVAKKDVMILPNVPRFVRMGDKATISARVINTGGKAVKGKARLELLDPETSQIVFASEQDVEVAADSVMAVSFDYDARNETRSLLVMKVMVGGDNFSDGEQHYLPVLPNQERVTVTVPFTQTEPGIKTIDLSALKDKTNSQLTVEYTNNPVWLMIQALPTVGHPHDKCAVCQAASFYANAIGRYIMNQNPNAKNVFEAWSRETGNETSLMSSLEKNQELKDLLLNETPWVVDANREDEQKARLSDFFDANQMDNRLENALTTLRGLQRADGSWSWWPGMDGSLYITAEVSEMLVRLNQMAGHQTQTEQMLKGAFRYMGKEMVALVNELKKAEKKGIKPVFPSHKALQWLYICTLDGRTLSADVQSANTYLKNLLKKETTYQSIYDKAMSAIVLNNKTYIKSLKEYTVYREDMGRYYDTNRALYSWRDYRIPTQVAAIEAIKRLTPEDTKTIEEMQRWLLQEKRTQAWDTPVNSADAIYAFLSEKGKVKSERLRVGDGTSGMKFAAAPHTVLKVDGNEIETSKATAGIGYVKTTMSGDNKQTFTAEKTSTGTSWGAVYMQFMQPVSDIEAQNSGIKVTREILSAEANSSLFTIHSSFSVGDRIKVRITIEADRDYDFVQVVDKRAACMEPVNQLSGYHWGYYIAPKDCATNYYFDRLAKGKHVIETEYYIDRPGTYETGTCTASCAYSPEFRGVAKSQTIKVE